MIDRRKATVRPARPFDGRRVACAALLAAAAAAVAPPAGSRAASDPDASARDANARARDPDAPRRDADAPDADPDATGRPGDPDAAGDPGGVTLKEDPPLAGEPARGTVRVRIEPAERVRRVWLTSRVTDRQRMPDRSDPNRGRYVFRALPGDARYDVCVETDDGRRFEGIDLSFVGDRLLRLAEKRRRQLGLPVEPDRPFTRRDANEIAAYLDGVKDFMDGRRALYVKGHGRRATALVEALRTSEFYAAREGEVIWRVELWYFKYQYGGWDQLKETARVLVRRRIPAARWRTICRTWHPELSVYVRPTGYAPAVSFTIPGKADPTRGRTPDGPVKLTSDPHVLGLDKASEPATKPAREAPGEAGEAVEPE